MTRLTVSACRILLTKQLMSLATVYFLSHTNTLSLAKHTIEFSFPKAIRLLVLRSVLLKYNL